MKRRILFLTVLALLLFCFAGCTAEKTGEPASQLLIGYGRASIVPDFPIQLSGGYGNEETRYFNNVLDPVYVTAIAFTDQDNNTVILMQYDLGKPNNRGIVLARKEISNKFEIPTSNIMASATHTHSGPLVTDKYDQPETAKQMEDLLYRQTVAACTEAMENRLPAEVYAASVDTVNLNFIRHYYMDDGSIVGDNFGLTTGKSYVRHTRKVDPQLQLLRFKREGGKDVVLANFQAHPLRTGGSAKLDLSSDFVGPMTTYVEENLDCHFAYFSGASGDIDPTSRIQSENITGNHSEQGIVLGQYAVQALSAAKKLESGTIQYTETKFKDSMRLCAFSFGDVGFVNAAYEMFCSNGKYIKENSPFEMTFVTTYGLSCGSYIPDAATFAYDCISYEESSCVYPEGTGEVLAETFVDLLNQLHATYSAE